MTSPPRPTSRRDSGSRSGARSALWIIITAACIWGASCQKQYETTWRAEVPSPDGQWIASASTIRNFGPGTAYQDTAVYLKRANASSPPQEVLGFSHNEGEINLKMKWESPSHLEATYNEQAIVDFQVVKYNGIEISIRPEGRTR